MSETRLFRTAQGRVIGGVAGGLADFFGMDPTIVRLIFVLLAVFGGGGVLLYIILWIVLPERNAFNTFSARTTPPDAPPSGSDSGIGETYEGFPGPNRDPYKENEHAEKRKFEGSLIGGMILILIGSFFLAERFIPRIHFGDFWPLLLVVVGVVLIFNNLPSRGKGPEKDANI